MRRSRIIMFLAVALLVGMAKAWADQKGDACLQSDEDARYRYYYVEAVRQQDMGNYENAFEIFRRCEQIKPDAAETCFALGAFYMAFDQDSIGMYYLKRAVALEPENADFCERLARTYLYKDRVKEAAEVYEKLVALTDEPSQYLDVLIRIYEQQRDYEKMLATLNRLEVQEGQQEEITLSKMQVLSFMGDEDGAYKELKSLVDAHPFDMNLQVMMGNWLVSNARKDEALATFRKVLQEEPDNAQCQMSLMDYYNAEGNTVQADSLLYTMLVNPRTEPQTRVTLVRNWAKSLDADKDSLKMMQMFDNVLALPQKSSELMEMKVQFLSALGAPKDSIRNGWEKVLQISPENVQARLNLIQLMWEDSIDDNVIRECRKAVEYVPDSPLLYYYLGLAEAINQHNEEAVATLRKATAYIEKDTPQRMSAEMYMLLGDCLQRLHRSKEAYCAYDSCLVYEPDMVMCLNNYAYYLSVEGIDLKRAEKMAYRAITAEPNSATYLDTYAWILYKQKRYEESRIYIDQALKSDTDSVHLSGDIMEHAGDIYYRLGYVDKAREFWQKALPLGVDNQALLEKKVKKGKL